MVMFNKIVGLQVTKRPYFMETLKLISYSICLHSLDWTTRLDYWMTGLLD